MGNHLYTGYFILNTPRIDCMDFSMSSLTNYLLSRIISVEINLELIDLYSLDSKKWSWIE